MTKHMNILGVKMDNLFKKEILEKIEYFLNEPKFHQIATVNPEFILEAQKNEQFKNILNSCDLNIADGIGIGFAFLRFGKYLKSRITGADLMLEILKIASNRGLGIFLACRQDGLSSFEETKNAILKIYPKLKVQEIPVPEALRLTYVNRSASGTVNAILFCNFGAPQQELFINSVKNDSIRLAMGVGGSFDFLTGKIKRAPKWMQFLGFEWLWRLILQPKRIKRIFNAIIIFPIKIILCKK